MKFLNAFCTLPDCKTTNKKKKERLIPYNGKYSWEVISGVLLLLYQRQRFTSHKRKTWLFAHTSFLLSMLRLIQRYLKLDKSTIQVAFVILTSDLVYNFFLKSDLQKVITLTVYKRCIFFVVLYVQSEVHQSDNTNS